ncbi:MAG TPA: type II CAAX endopeptidase family protein [Ktedonobacterales bacterium]
MEADRTTFTDDHQSDDDLRALETVGSDQEPQHSTKRRSPLRWIALAAILLVGNLANALSWHFAVPIDSGVFSISLAVGLYVTPGLSELRRSRVAAQGWRYSWKSLALAVAAGLALAIPSIVFFVVASGHGGLGYGAIPSLPVPSLLMRELIEIPLLTAILEELVFRQYLWRLFAQKRLITTVLVNAGIFTLWHLVVNARTVMASHVAASPLLDAGAYVGSLATIFAAGVVFALVRWRTGSFAYSAITHWVLLGVITLAAWLL